jgi:hypothetical protein
MKKVIVTVFLLLIALRVKAPEFKGSTYQIPRIEGERPEPNAYQSYSPAASSTRPDPLVVVPTRRSLEVPKVLENESPGPQNIVFDSPAMTRK